MREKLYHKVEYKNSWKIIIKLNVLPKNISDLEEGFERLMEEMVLKVGLEKKESSIYMHQQEWIVNTILRKEKQFQRAHVIPCL